MPEFHDSIPEQTLQKHGVCLEKDQITVEWSRDSNEHPRNWSFWSKCYTAAVVIWLEAYMTAISSAGTASGKEAAKEYSTTQTIGYLGFVTVYLLGQTLGSLFLAPISEIFGRRTIYIVGNVSFGIASVITGTPSHLAAAIIGRFFQGVAASIPATVAFGNFDDMYDAGTRIWVVYWYTLCGMAGLALGPIYSSYVTYLLGWRWVYHISAMMSGASAVACFFIRESNATQLLQRKAALLREEIGNKDLKPRVDHSHDDEKPSVKAFFQTHIRRPVYFLLTEPLVMLCAILCSIAFSLLYAATESLTIIYMTPPFDMTFTTSRKASLSFIAILIGEIIDILPRIYDHYYLRHRRSKKQRIYPESKIHGFALACPALAIGLWILSWTVPQRVTTVPWPISMIGLVCIGFAANDFSYVLFGYMTDAYGFYSASAASAVSTARTLAAGIFPLFVTFMYEGLGNNHATTILACVATVFCFTPWLFIQKGRDLRERSRWATKGAECLAEENSHINDNDEEDDDHGDDDDQQANDNSNNGEKFRKGKSKDSKRSDNDNDNNYIDDHQQHNEYPRRGESGTSSSSKSIREWQKSRFPSHA